MNAELLNREGELGVIACGAYADVLLIDGDPLTNLELLMDQGAHLDFVMRNGDIIVNRVA